MNRRLERLCLMLCLLLTNCSLLHNERLLYDRHDIRIGIEADPTVSRSEPPVLNDHPAMLTPMELESLLAVIQVSGWSGTLTGLIASPRAVPLLTPKELSAISPYLAAAFQEARPTERIFFSVPKSSVAYSEDRTEGSLFLRGRYLHVVVTDHAAFLRADTGGGEPRDSRDTKGMKLWVAPPARGATVPGAERPRWAPFETVHISLNAKEMLAKQADPLPGLPATIREAPDSRIVDVPQRDLELQLRELTTSNLELRGRLAEQNKRMEQLRDQLDELRLELNQAKSKKPAPRRIPAR